MLPPLHRLCVSERRSVDASWQWDPASYQVRFSIDTAIVEQVNGLGSVTSGVFVPADRPFPAHQLKATDVLRAVREYCIQRLWDIECAVPRLNLLEDQPLQSGDTRSEPFPDSAAWLVSEVARWTAAVRQTPTADQAARAAARVSGGDVPDEEEDAEPLTEIDDDLLETTLRERILEAQKEARGSELRLKHALVSVENKLMEVENGEWESEKDAELEVAQFLVQNYDMLLNPGISSVRRLPPQNYYEPRHVAAQRYVRWCKSTQVLFDGRVEGNADLLYGRKFQHTFVLPQKLDGSFFTGDVDQRVNPLQRLRQMQMEHVVPRSHLKNAMLIKEFGDPRHLSMLTVFANQSENAAKGDKFLPLALNGPKFNEILQSSKEVYTGNSDRFNQERRQMAARIVLAGYLSLIMLERRPDANTELGPRKGGVYYRYRMDVYKLATSTPRINSTRMMHSRTQLTDIQAEARDTFRRAWTWCARFARTLRDCTFPTRNGALTLRAARLVFVACCRELRP